eukprot:scaffold840_cov344-Pavlova_lutheri.AAC.1
MFDSHRSKRACGSRSREGTRRKACRRGRVATASAWPLAAEDRWKVRPKAARKVWEESWKGWSG